MATRDEVLIKIRTQGGKAAAADIERARKQIDGLGRSTSPAAAGLGRVGSAATGMASRAADAASRIAKLTAAAGALAGTALATKAVQAGAEYNKMQDAQMVAFTTLLKSRAAAQEMMKDIQDLALESPVLDPGSTGDAARMLMAYGLSAQQVLPMVKALGDMSAASGKSIAEVMPRGAMALGQVASKGKLQAEELNQLAESVGLSRDRIREALGMSRDEFEQSFTPGNSIPADVAIPAIQKAMEGQSKGAAELLSKTTAGQISQLREVMARELGNQTRPWYDAFGDTAGGVASILNRSDLDTEQKLRLSWDVAEVEFGPLLNGLRDAVEDARVGEKIVDGIEEYTPKVVTAFADGVVHGAPKIAGAAASSFMDMGTWGKVLTAAVLLRRFRGPFGMVGGPLAGILGRSMLGAGRSAWGPVGARLGQTVGAQAARSAKETAAIRSMLLGDAIKAKAGPGMGVAGGALGAMLGAALAAKALDELTGALTGDKISDKLREGVTGRNRDGRRTMPGTGGFGASPGVRTPDSTRLAELEAWFKGAERRRDGTLVGSRNIVGLGPVERNLTSKDRDELESLRKRLRPRATGGTVRPGEFTIVGERGPELMRLPSGTEITSNRQARAQASGARARGREVVYRTPIVTVLQASGRELARVVHEHDEVVELRR